MIHRIYSSLPTFKELKLHAGLNILLSDKTVGATEQQTRNRAGKSTLVELIHFVLGGNCDSDSTFRAPLLIDSSFGLEFDVFGGVAGVSRSASTPSKIVVDKGASAEWPVQLTSRKNSDIKTVSNMAWRRVLGKAFFGLDEPAETEDVSSDGGRPTFRSLFSYFARRESSGGMREPTRNNEMQQTGDAQIALCFLLGMDWNIPQEWERIRKSEKQIRELKAMVGQGFLPGILGSAASLQASLVVAEEKLKKVTTTLSTFHVHEQYHHLEREASMITKQIGDLADENELDRTYKLELDGAMAAEEPPAPADLARLYDEVGVVIPTAALRRYEDVLKFHESVVRNRRKYLEAESEAALARMKARTEKRGELDDRRARVMAILRSHGALEQFMLLQAENGRLQGEVETVRRRFEAASQLESTSSTMESDRAKLVDRLRLEFAERNEIVKEAITTFSNLVEEIYGEPGRLEFHPTRNGPEFHTYIQGDRSRGVGNIQIFCFDMMLQRMCARNRFGPGFLIHDSHLFDGVDPRQIGSSLSIGARMAEELGFQYLVTLNSDVLAELPKDFDTNKYVIQPRITDATDTGGLFGLRFEPPRSASAESMPRVPRAEISAPLKPKVKSRQDSKSDTALKARRGSPPPSDEA